MYENTSKRIKIVFGISFASYFLVAIYIFLIMLSAIGAAGIPVIASFIIPCSIPVLIFPFLFILYENKQKERSSYSFDIHSFAQIILYVILIALHIVVIINNRNLDEVFSLKPDKRNRITCNKLHSKYLRNVSAYIGRKVSEKLKKQRNLK